MLGVNIFKYLTIDKKILIYKDKSLYLARFSVLWIAFI